MECKKIQEMLAAYLEGFVSSEERILIEEHIPSCHGCSNALEDLKRTGALVKGLEEVEPPPWMKQRVMARVRAEGETRKSIFRRLLYPLHVKVPIEAFATVLIAVIAIYVFRAVDPEIKRDHGPSATQQVAAEGEGSKEAPQEALKTGADSRASGRETPALRSRHGGAQGERIRKREDPPVPGRETPAKESLGPGGGEGAGAQRVRPSPASPPALRALAKKRTEGIGVTIYAEDIGTAIREIETLLVRLGANRIERKSAEGAEVITAELRAENLKDLFEKLKGLGEVKEKDAPHPPPTLPLEGGGTADIAEGNAGIRIEIINR